MSVVVDALGKQCPIPVVMAKKALAELQPPDTLEILVDNEAAVQNLSQAGGQLPAACPGGKDRGEAVLRHHGGLRPGAARGGDCLRPGCPAGIWWWPSAPTAWAAERRRWARH